MIRVRGDQRSPVLPETPGMRKLWEILEARCRHSSVEIKDAFDEPATAHYLCEMSGGHPRHLLTFIKSAADKLDALPIRRAAAEKAVRDYANALLRGVPDEAWPKLSAFDTPRDDLPKDDLHQQMLLLLYLFEYMNGSPWYEVNPVLRTLERLRRTAQPG